MNKYIKSDLQDSIKLMRVAIMNSLRDIEIGEETEINLGPYISQPLFLECLQEAKWEIEVDDSEYLNSIYYEVRTPSSKEVIIQIKGGDWVLSFIKHIQVTISMCLSSDQEIEVPGNFDESNEQALKKIVKEQVFLPNYALQETGYDKEWYIDDFIVV